MIRTAAVVMPPLIPANLSNRRLDISHATHDEKTLNAWLVGEQLKSIDDNCC
jgi:hypothetical protein